MKDALDKRTKELPFLRTPYNYDRNAASDETAIDQTGEQSLTKQSFTEESDINTIVRRFGLTGQMPTDLRAPTYGDFTNIPDFHSAMNAIRQAQESFMQMPAEVRARFHNDPGEFVDFCSDPQNTDEARKLGLLVPSAAAPNGPLATTGKNPAEDTSTNPQASKGTTPPSTPPAT